MKEQIKVTYCLFNDTKAVIKKMVFKWTWSVKIPAKKLGFLSKALLFTDEGGDYVDNSFLI